MKLKYALHWDSLVPLCLSAVLFIGLYEAGRPFMPSYRFFWASLGVGGAAATFFYPMARASFREWDADLYGRMEAERPDLATRSRDVFVVPFFALAAYLLMSIGGLVGVAAGAFVEGHAGVVTGALVVWGWLGGWALLGIMVAAYVLLRQGEWKQKLARARGRT